jgi:hypothetical protein
MSFSEVQLIFLASVRFSEIDEIKERFRVGGIPIFVAPDFTLKANDIPGLGASQQHAAGRSNWYSVSVCLDEQFEEGKRLFNDPNYTVMSPVDVAEFEAEMDKLGANREVELNLADNGLFWIVAAVILGLVIWIVRTVSTAH